MDGVLSYRHFIGVYMSWQTEMVPLVRVLINDITTPVTYTDERLESLIVTSAQLVSMSVEFDYSYSMNIAAGTISPDPTINRDDPFINLVSLYSAWIISLGEAKAGAAMAIRVVDGPSTVDASQSSKDKMALSQLMKKYYEHAKAQYIMGNSRAAQAILTPYTTEMAVLGLFYGDLS